MKVAAPKSVATAITLTPAKCRVVVIAFLPRWNLWLCPCRRGHGERLVADRQRLDVGGDGSNLVGIVGVLEGRHARRAIGDDAANQLFASARRLLVELRSIHAGN